MSNLKNEVRTDLERRFKKFKKKYFGDKMNHGFTGAELDECKAAFWAKEKEKS